MKTLTCDQCKATTSADYPGSEWRRVEMLGFESLADLSEVDYCSAWCEVAAVGGTQAAAIPAEDIVAHALDKLLGEQGGDGVVLGSAALRVGRMVIDVEPYEGHWKVRPRMAGSAPQGNETAPEGGIRTGSLAKPWHGPILRRRGR